MTSAYVLDAISILASLAGLLFLHLGRDGRIGRDSRLLAAALLFSMIVFGASSFLGASGVLDRFELPGFFRSIARHAAVFIPLFWGLLFYSLLRSVSRRDLEQSEERLRRVIDLLPHRVYAKDRHGRYLLANQTVADLYATTVEALIGRSQSEFHKPPEEMDFIFSEDHEVIARGQEHHEPLISVRTLQSGRTYKTHKIPCVFPGSSEVVVLGVSVDITDQIRTEKELRIKDFAISSLVAPLVMADLDGNLTYVNHAFLDLWGYDSAQETAGRSFLDLWQDRTVAENVVSLIRERGWWVGDLKARSKEDASFDVHLATSVVRDQDDTPLCMVSSFLDVTDRNRVFDALRRSEEMMRAVFENATHGMAIWNGERRLVKSNARFAEMLGYAVDKMTHLSPQAITHPEDQIRQDREYERLKSGQIDSHAIEKRYIRRDGSEFWAELTVNAVRDAEGGLDGTIAIVVDITERKRIEEERQKLEAQFQHAQKLESLGILAGGIAHDFNNLLMGILGNADLALDQISALSPVRNNILEVERSAKRAADLCRQMLAYSGKGKFMAHPISLNEVVEEMVHLLEVSISKKAILKFDFAENLPAVEADPTQIRQVIMNLITNASEAIGDCSGVISIATGAMSCDRDYLIGTHLAEELAEGPYVYLEVSDTGCGMDKATRDRMFDPFFTTKFTGRGLGMAAVLGIVRGHKGTIKVYSEPKRGTTIKVLFPAIDRPPEPLERGAARPGDWKAVGTVLLVDDEETVRVVGKHMLERAGLNVLTACDGCEAIDLYRRYGDEIRCVILDLTMPHMDGEETFRELRRVCADVKVILSSGYNEQEIVTRFAGKGLAGFIQKPYRTLELLTAIRQVLGN